MPHSSLPRPFPIPPALHATPRSSSCRTALVPCHHVGFHLRYTHALYNFRRVQMLRIKSFSVMTSVPNPAPRPCFKSTLIARRRSSRRSALAEHTFPTPLFPFPIPDTLPSLQKDSSCVTMRDAQFDFQRPDQCPHPAFDIVLRRCT